MFLDQTLKILRFLLAIFLLVCGQTWAQTSPLDSQTASAPKIAISLTFFLDATGTQTAEQTEQLAATEFKPFNAEKPIAIKSGALWLRFNATSPASQQGWRLILPMATVDEATLFNRSAEGVWIKQIGGDTQPMRNWAQPGRYPSFVLSDEQLKSVDYLLQVRHQRGLFSTLPRVVNERAFITSQQNEHLVLGMYFGLAALVVILALSRALVYRDTGFASYAVYVALLALTIATVSGISALYLWPQWPISTLVSPLLATSAGAAACWFVRVVTRPKRFSRWLDRALACLIFIAPLSGVWASLQQSGVAYTAYSVVMLVIALALLCAIVGALWQGDHDSRWVAFGFFPIVVAILLLVMRNFGFIPASGLTELVIPVASALEVIILFYGLHCRVSQPRSIATRVTRLLKIDPLTGLHTRQVLIKKLGQALTAAQRSQQRYALLIIHLANAEAIEKKYGREVADRALVLAACCVRDVISPGDFLARAFTNHFALLLESPVSLSQAKDVATHALANALRKADDLPRGQPLQFHIALGYPNTPITSTNGDAEIVLNGLIAAVSEMGSDPGKAIRFINIP